MMDMGADLMICYDEGVQGRYDGMMSLANRYLFSYFDSFRHSVYGMYRPFSHSLSQCNFFNDYLRIGLRHRCRRSVSFDSIACLCLHY